MVTKNGNPFLNELMSSPSPMSVGKKSPMGMDASAPPAAPSGDVTSEIQGVNDAVSAIESNISGGTLQDPTGIDAQLTALDDAVSALKAKVEALKTK